MQLSLKGMIESEAALVDRMRRGDERAFDVLYSRHHAAVYRYALRMTGSPELADDTVQETFLALLRGGGYNATLGPLRSYLFGTARNLLFRMWGEQARQEGVHPSHADDGPDQLQGLEAAEQFALLRRALASLPPRYREVVVLCELEELSYAEVAELLGCAVGTIRSRLSRAKALLAEKLGRDRRSRVRCGA